MGRLDPRVMQMNLRTMLSQCGGRSTTRLQPRESDKFFGPKIRRTNMNVAVRLPSCGELGHTTAIRWSGLLRAPSAHRRYRDASCATIEKPKLERIADLHAVVVHTSIMCAEMSV